MPTRSSLHTAAIENLIAGWLPPNEFAILEAVCDTLLPSLEPPAASSEVVTAYYRRCARDLHVAQRIAEILGLENPQAQAEFRQLLALLASPIATLLLVGSPRPFVVLAQGRREQYLYAMANSPLGQLRQGYQAMKRLAGFVYFSVPDAQGINPNWDILDYAVPSPPGVGASLTPTRTTPPSIVGFQPIIPLTISQDTTLEADAVIIGSGAGGGVVAGELAQAGKSVIVLEKGGYNHEANFTLQEAQAMAELYLKRATLTTKDLGIIILAGSTLGGGTTVNWMTSLRTPPNVLEEWEQRSGLHGYFTGSQLQESFAAVEQRISVNSENSQHNRQNQVLYDGCTALGYHVATLPRNAIGCNQRCGLCGFGCRYGCKQSTMKTYVQDAYDHGARIIVHCSADKVLIENGRAVGVKAKVTDTETAKTYHVTIRAKVVVVASGSIHSPAVLLRSGLENQHIGRHLYLHPTATIGGFYPYKLYPWQGVLQSAYSDQFAHLDGNYGYKLEVAPGHPGLFGLATPWHSAREYRESMTRVANIATIIVLTRDKGAGSVTLDRYGEPIVDYVVSAYDRKHLLHGLRQAARIHFAAGAEGVISLHSKPTYLECAVNEAMQEQRLRVFDQQLERHGMGVNRIMMFSAHQMGTCRMGADPKMSVTDEYGQVYGVKGLFVCDASLFPAPSGVNPMLSIMSLVHRNCQYIKAVL